MHHFATLSRNVGTLTVCSDQFATSAKNLLVMVANLLTPIPQPIPPQVEIFTRNIAQFI